MFLGSCWAAVPRKELFHGHMESEADVGEPGRRAEAREAAEAGSAGDSGRFCCEENREMKRQLARQSLK